MEDNEKVIKELFSRLEQLTRQQKVFQDEIQSIHRELVRLKGPETKSTPIQQLVQTATEKVEPKAGATITSPDAKPSSRVSPEPIRKSKAPWEDFIGTNLLNKVGIAVLVLGIAFGAKYSIDHNPINPLTRIILGYAAGTVLLAVAFRLRMSHPGFSAVLLSGGMTVLYFITYAAYSFYDPPVISQAPAFVLMVMFTLFTVFAAVRYNLEVIGIIGLVGAYAVPILLSDGSGRAAILFSYITIINTGILFLAFKKYWKRLYYLAFILTWFTFGSWYAFSFYGDHHVAISLTFSTIFFLTFYTTFLAYKLVRREALGKWDVVCMLFNSFLYFGYGYITIDSLRNGEEFLGLFTVFTALVHFIACVIIYKTQKDFSDIFYFVAGMVLVFLTIAVPVQLEGNWVTLVWALEAALMFWIGRTKSFPAYEKLSYPLIVLAFLSLFHDWSSSYPGFYYYTYQADPTFRIFLNVQFFTSMLVGCALAFVVFISRKFQPGPNFKKDSVFILLITIGLPVLTVFVFYVGFFKEIEAFWNHAYATSRVPVQGSEGIEYDQYDNDLLRLKRIWLIMYSAIFAGGLYLLQLRWRTDLSLTACLVLNCLILFSFVTAGLIDLSALRASFLEQDLATYYPRGYSHIAIRYAAIFAVLPLLWYNKNLVKRQFFNDATRKGENLYYHFIILLLLSSELIHWLEMARVENTFKLSLSILWGAYALLLIVFGLSRDVKHIRLGAIVLFAVTLIKLFIYDMADMSTISRTIVMIILGVLLLTASFIYNKYKRSTGNETP